MHGQHSRLPTRPSWGTVSIPPSPPTQPIHQQGHQETSSKATCVLPNSKSIQHKAGWMRAAWSHHIQGRWSPAGLLACHCPLLHFPLSSISPASLSSIHSAHSLTRVLGLEVEGTKTPSLASCVKTALCPVLCPLRLCPRLTTRDTLGKIR
jgi:hypothetical protein